ncbi:Glycosyltransferase 61 [Gracilaria domingensis]|nr:Glycosyltransferase 61 [Gracilaria domingensis]
MGPRKHSNRPALVASHPRHASVNDATRAYLEYPSADDSVLSRTRTRPPRTSKFRGSRPRAHGRSSVLPGSQSKLLRPLRSCVSHLSSEASEVSVGRLWVRIPHRLRRVLFIAGFIVVYYYVFAKHHYYDREISDIHAEVEKLVQEASESGFMGRQFVEADLPPILRESVVLPVLGNQYNSSEDKTATKSGSSTKKAKPDKGSADKKLSKQKGSTEDDSLPLKKKKKKKKKATKEADVEPKAKSKAKAGEDEGESNHVSDTHVERTKMSSRETVPASSKEQKNSASPSPLLDSPIGKGAGTSTESDSGHGSRSTSVSPVSPSPNAARIETIENGAQENSTTDVVATEVDDSIFEDLSFEDVPKGMIPVLKWKYEKVKDPTTTEQIFGIGDRLEHIGVYKPLCIDSNSSDALVFEGETICSGFNRTEGWLIHYCAVMREALYKEDLLQVQDAKKELTWLQENEADIQWVEGVTVLQILERNCGNIAHYGGRLLFLQHIIENIAAYVSMPAKVDQVLILPTHHIMKRFLYPQNYEYWHKTMLSALLAPSKPGVGTLGNFLYRLSKAKDLKEPLVQLLHNYSLAGSENPNKKYVCFRKVVIPGFLKGRFFVNDMEYPSKRISLQSRTEGAPSVPRDSLRMRERVSALIRQTPVLERMRKVIVLLDRNGSRRVFETKTRSKMIDMFTSVGKEKGFAFKIVDFSKKPFEEQYQMVSGSAIAIGIHGANLVNTMFMPPLSVLIELFPNGFWHAMYANGGNSGLKYFGYEMKTGPRYPGLSKFRSVAQCIKYDNACKLHYRDAYVISTDEDTKAVESILRSAIEWCEKIGFETSP